MKRIGNLYPKISDPANVRAAIMHAARGKRRRRDVQAVLNDIDRKAAELADELAAGRWVPGEYTDGTVEEGTSRKTRILKKPKFWSDQCVHWAIYQVIGPPIYKSMYSLSCGSVPGRGTHYGKRIVEKWIQRDRKNTKYYLKMDIRHYYPSVDIRHLLDMLAHKFKDPRLLALLKTILEKDEGLSIGLLLSQPLANFYLTPTDYYIKQTLGAVHYIRYMDDMVVFGRNKKELHRIRRAVAEYVAGYGLTIKGNWQVCRLDKEPLDFMGFRFYRDRVTLRRAIMLRITRKVRRVDRKGRRATAADAAAVLSYLGWIKHSNSYNLFKTWVRPYLHIQRLKNLIRKESRKNANHQERKHRPTGGVGRDDEPVDGVP